MHLFGFLLQSLRVCVDHLRELLHDIIESIIVTSHVTLSNLLIKCG